MPLFLTAYVWASTRAAVYLKQLTPEVCFRQEAPTFWYTLTHPQGQKNREWAPASSCPINCYQTSETAGQLAAPMWVSITRSDRISTLLAALLHRPSGQSAPQLALHWWVMPAPSAACQKELGATEEVQISSNGLDPDGCADDNRPHVLSLRFCEKHRGHHNNTATLCMQGKYHWHVKKLLW